MNKFILSVFLFLALNASLVYTSSANNPTISLINFQKLFDSSKQQIGSLDLGTAFYSFKGSQLLNDNQTPQVQQELCNLAKTKVDKSSIESIFYATSLASLAQNCQLQVSDFQLTITASSSSSSLVDLYYYVNTALNLKQQIDVKKINKQVLDALKADSSILNQAYALNIAYYLNENEKPFYNNIEDLLDQADEVDKNFLQYEGGVSVTCLVLEGIFNLCEKLKQIPPKFDQTRLTKFTNYLISKRYPTNPKTAYFLLRASLKLTNNQFYIPVVANRLSSIGISLTQPNLLIGLTNIIGTQIKQVQFNLEATSSKAQKSNGQALFSTKKTFTSKSSDGTTFELKLVEQTEPIADFYLVVLNIVPKVADKRFYLLENTVEVKATTKISINDIEAGIADRDQSAPKLNKVKENIKLKLEGDQQSKFYLKFSVALKSKGTPFEVHQAFVRFTHSLTKREIIFLAQLANNKYSAEVDLAKNAKNFRQMSGQYSVDLVIADTLVENPQTISVADLKLQFIEDSITNQQDNKANLYSKKPEIKHLFRPNEPTPPTIVSSTFALLCIAPVVLMFLLWIKIGFNFSRFSFSLSGIIFHATLALIFGLYYCYWIKLNMFTTVKYLTILSGVALFFGNRLLSSLASQNKEKKN